MGSTARRPCRSSARPRDDVDAGAIVHPRLAGTRRRERGESITGSGQSSSKAGAE